MTTIPAEQKKRHRLTQEDCDTARLLMARQRTMKEIGEIIGVDPSTVGKIRLAGYDLQTYLEQRKAMNRKTAVKKEMKRKWRTALFSHAPEEVERDLESLERLSQEAAGGITKGVEQVAGQIQMELPEAEEQKQDEQSKQMKFQAAMMDKLLKKLDELIAVLKGGAGNE